jgi:chromosome segregation ATPase
MIDGRKRRVYEKKGEYFIFLTKKTKKSVAETSIFKEDSPKKTPIKSELKKLMDENKDLAGVIERLEQNLQEKEQECDSRIVQYSATSPGQELTPQKLDCDRDLQSIREELQSIQSERDALLVKERYSQEKSERISMLESRITSLQDELTRVIEDDKTKIDSATAKVYEVMAERDNFIQKHDEMANELREQKELVQEIRLEKDRAMKQLEDLLESESASSKAQLKSVSDNLERITTQLQEAEAEKQRLEKELRDFIEESQNRIKELEDRLSDTEGRHGSLVNEHSALVNEHSALVNELREQKDLVNQVRLEKDEAVKKLEDMLESEPTVSKAALKAASDKVDRLTTQLEEAEAEKQRLETELRGVISDLQGRLSDTENEKEQLRRSLKEEIRQKDEYAAEIAGLALTRDSMLEEKIAEFEKLKLKLEKLEEEKASVERNLQDRTFAEKEMFAKLDSKQAEIDQCKMKVDDMRVELASRTGCESALRDLQDARDQLARAMERTDGLQAELGECVKKSFENIETNTTVLQELEKQFDVAIEELEIKLRECNDRSKSLEEGAEASSREIATLYQQIKALETDNKQLRSDIQSKTCDLEVAKVNEECASDKGKIQKRLDSCFSDKNLIKTDADELSSVYEKAASENIGLKMRVEELSEKVDASVLKESEYETKLKLRSDVLEDLFDIIKTLDKPTQKNFESIVEKYSSLSE